MSGLNADVFAGDVLREEYHRQIEVHRSRAREAAHLRSLLEEAEALQKTAAERATSIMETLLRHGGMLAPEEQSA